jgi:ABC-type molybdate transport system permease subunit
MIALLANIYISIAAVVKRARETATSVGLIIFLWIVLTPIIVLYLLFAPAKRGENEKMSAWSIVLSIIISIVIVLALLFVIALPKLAKTREAALQAKQEQLLKSTHQESNLTNEN